MGIFKKALHSKIDVFVKIGKCHKSGNNSAFVCSDLLGKKQKKSSTEKKQKKSSTQKKQKKSSTTK